MFDVLIAGGDVYDGTGGEENLRAALARPWVAISSDGMSMAPEGAFLRAPAHPRAYGSFARVLGYCARDEKVLPLTEATRRMSSLPAATLGRRDRGKVTISSGTFTGELAGRALAGPGARR